MAGSGEAPGKERDAVSTGGLEDELMHSGARGVTDCGINTRDRQELRGVLRTTDDRAQVTCVECLDALAYFDTKVRAYAGTPGPAPQLWRFGKPTAAELHDEAAAAWEESAIDQEQLQRILDKHCGRAESAPPPDRGEDD